ncbi:hypothetical protein LTR66_010938 [Elasticomyces elasticus]|nr:hypothetical protein LTR66_010938 [Elasticomyces elasticus]
MEVPLASTVGITASSEAGTPAVSYDDDARHSATPASTEPKPATMAALLGEPKDFKNVGTRFYEDCHETDALSPRLRLSKLADDKEDEASTPNTERVRPLRLLDLPVDILKDIVKEPRSGVDALTYGLATLVMAEEIFGEAPSQRTEVQDGATRASNGPALGQQGLASEQTIRRRRGNHYAHFTRKFSLGNGPTDWVQEYLIAKEGGKMLGTLVALAVARMRSLETFVWDMPTGILRDVWLALSSLAERGDGQDCRLERLWVRWHDNSSTDSGNAAPPPPPPPLLNNIPLPAIPGHNSHAAQISTSVPSAASLFYTHTLDRVEHPTFSVLPPLKSLSVMDIDELPYLDEMSVLIGRSRHRLRELRVGVARHAVDRNWVTVWEGDDLRQVDKEMPTVGAATLGEKRLGGILGILTGHVHNMRARVRHPLPARTAMPPPIPIPTFPPAQMSAGPSITSPPIFDELETPEQTEADIVEEDATPFGSAGGMTSFSDVLPEELTSKWHKDEVAPPPVWKTTDPSTAVLAPAPETSPTSAGQDVTISSVMPSEIPLLAVGTENARVDTTSPQMSVKQREEKDDKHDLCGQLQLEALELERVPLSVPVLQEAIDWSRLTSLTLLHCQNHEQLWKTLRRNFAPTYSRKPPTFPSGPRRLSMPKLRRSSVGEDRVYRLHLTKIHTNAVSPSLISFLKETLAPNSLEILFLQEARTYTSNVSIDAIYRGPIRRHRNSLKKVLIDSSEKNTDGHAASNSRWKRWMLNREILGFMTSGKMSSLRELGMTLDYRDWHYFLQRLPKIPHLRSLYIPFLADHVHGTNLNACEIALQVVDIVALRPDIELCYMGIATKCFEILENKRSDLDLRNESHLGLGSGHVADAAESDDEDDAEDDDEDDDDDGDGGDGDATESDNEDDDHDDSDSDDVYSNAGEKLGPRLRLREILFYDDKVAVFKARHGRL